MRGGRHVCVCAATASGNRSPTCCARGGGARRPARARAPSFPTKALAHDQLASLSAFADAACPHLLAAAFDGDTPMVDRPQLRRKCHAFLTNPDILHSTVLRKHREWADVLANLKVIAVDECHAYRGVFGSHVALVLRRLRRLCARYGSHPTIVCCSATIANPREHASALTGVAAADLAVVDAAARAGRGPRALEPAAARAVGRARHDGLPPGGAARRHSAVER